MVLVEYIIRYFQPDSEAGIIPRAISIDPVCLERFMKLPKVIDQPHPDHWVKKPILTFQWNVDKPPLISALLMAKVAKKPGNPQVTKRTHSPMGSTMTLDQFVEKLILQPPAPHPLLTTRNWPDRLFDHGETKIVTTATKAGAEMEGFEELTRRITKMVSAYLLKGDCGSHSDDPGTKTSDRFDSIYGLGTMVAHAAAFQGALSETSNVTYDPKNISTHMADLLKTSLGNDCSKNERENFSLVEWAKQNNSVFGMALQHAPSVRSKYQGILENIQAQTPAVGMDDDPYFIPIPGSMDDGGTPKYDESAFDGLLVDPGGALNRKGTEQNYKEIEQMMQPQQMMQPVQPRAHKQKHKHKHKHKHKKDPPNQPET
jgi:hypothetical protein